MPLTTADISDQLLMDTSNAMQEIETHMTALAFTAVHNPEQEPAVRRVLEQLLEVMDQTEPPQVCRTVCQRSPLTRHIHFHDRAKHQAQAVFHPCRSQSSA